MPLILSPSFDEHTIDQIREHVAAVQARRMVAAMEFHAGRNAKLRAEGSKLELRLSKQYDMLAKEIDALNKAEDKLLSRLDNIQNLKNETGLLIDMIALNPDKEGESDV